MADIAKEDYSNGRKPILTKTQIFIIFLLLFVVLSILISFFALKEDAGDESESVINVNDLTRYPSFVYISGSEKDISKCNVLQNQHSLTSCRITSGVYSNITDFCLNSLTREDENEVFVYSSNNNESLEVKARDYCWILMSEVTKSDYCANIKDINARKICMLRRNE